MYSPSQLPVDILHVDMYAFFVFFEEVLDPSLKEKPLIVGGSIEGRGVVSAASYAARKYGIQSVISTARAKHLCPHANFLRGSHRLYSEYSVKVFEILRRYSLLVEPMLLCEAFVELTGCRKLHGPILKTAETIRNEIRDQLGLNAWMGIATNKLMVKIALAYCKLHRMLWIAPDQKKSSSSSAIEIIGRGLWQMGRITIPQSKGNQY
jgi:DNA polymerase IV